MEELMESLSKQTNMNFDLIVVEDGSSETCELVLKKYQDQIDIEYFYKKNSGPGDSRNYGMAKAKGEYLIFFDSDCIIPPNYFEKVELFLKTKPLDAFGGPDAADVSFSNVQKAINYAMTSIITTGGVRGKENNLDKFQPRSFNMGITKKTFEQIGGFSDIHPGEDPDLSYRIMKAGLSTGLIPNAFVYHKRRVDFSKFAKQVYKFGIVRPILIKWYPDKFKLTYTFPTIFLLGSLFLILLSIFFSWVFLIPILAVAGIVFLESLFRTKSLIIAMLSILASFIQLYSYGFGFLKSFIKILIFKGDEREVFKDFFFKS